MSLIVPPGYALASFIYTGSLGTSPFVTTLGVDLSLTTESLANIANRLFVIWDDTVMRETDNFIGLDQVSLQIGSDGPGGSVVSNAPRASGARSGSEAAVSMSAIMRKNTPLLGRSGRGRMFMPGLLTGGEVSGDGSIVDARRTDLVDLGLDLYNALVDPQPISGDSYPPVLLHSAAGPLNPTPITSFTPARLVGWIRGRIR